MRQHPVERHRDAIESLVAAPYRIPQLAGRQLRRDGKNLVPKAAVVCTYVADIDKGVNPRVKDGCLKMIVNGNFPHILPQHAGKHLRQGAERADFRCGPDWQVGKLGIRGAEMFYKQLV